MKLIWDYENGFVVNAETGEVLDTIFDYSRKDVEFERGLGKRSQVERIADEGMKVLKNLKRRGLKDERGTYVAYKIGITNKTVKSLVSKDEGPAVPDKYKATYQYFLRMIERDPVLRVRPTKSKRTLALAAAMIINGKSVSEVCRELGVNEKTLRRALKLLRSRV